MSDNDKLRTFFSGGNANSGNLYLGSGILHCGLCESSMVARRLYGLPAPQGGVRVMYACVMDGCQSVDVADADRALQGVAERFVSSDEVMRRLALGRVEKRVEVFERWLTICDDPRVARGFERTGHHLKAGFPTWDAHIRATEIDLAEALADRALLQAGSSREEQLGKIEAQRNEQIAELEALCGDRRRRKTAQRELGGRKELAVRVAALRRTARLLGVTHDLLTNSRPTPRLGREPKVTDWGQDVQKHVSERREILLTGLGENRVVVTPVTPEPDGHKARFQLRVVTPAGENAEPPTFR